MYKDTRPSPSSNPYKAKYDTQFMANTCLPPSQERNDRGHSLLCKTLGLRLEFSYASSLSHTKSRIQGLLVPVARHHAYLASEATGVRGGRFAEHIGTLEVAMHDGQRVKVLHAEHDLQQTP